MAETPPLGSETAAVGVIPTPPSPDPNRALRIERRIPRPVRKPEVVFKKPIKHNDRVKPLNSYNYEGRWSKKESLAESRVYTYIVARIDLTYDN
ncbi:hypothetical protein ALC60_05675 [Trachymyrmex zeteki]|uniref:Uncharacterized protein n=1 Tax=Mycetomoellerius zeteki TaxID=64791 RepID=A0A151X5A8_9HYME|nr:hypothetical protein ALC60_05675 [Trachymyrmex zeteki]